MKDQRIIDGLNATVAFYALPMQQGAGSGLLRSGDQGAGKSTGTDHLRQRRGTA